MVDHQRSNTIQQKSLFLMLFIMITLLFLVPACASTAKNAKLPWWKQQKIRYFWGQWVLSQNAGVPFEQLGG